MSRFLECCKASTGLSKPRAWVYTTGTNNILKNQNYPLVCDFDVRYDWRRHCQRNGFRDLRAPVGRTLSAPTSIVARRDDIDFQRVPAPAPDRLSILTLTVGARLIIRRVRITKTHEYEKFPARRRRRTVRPGRTAYGSRVTRFRGVNQKGTYPVRPVFRVVFRFRCPSSERTSDTRSGLRANTNVAQTTRPVLVRPVTVSIHQPKHPHPFRPTEESETCIRALLAAPRAHCSLSALF